MWCFIVSTSQSRQSPWKCEARLGGWDKTALSPNLQLEQLGTTVPCRFHASSLLPSESRSCFEQLSAGLVRAVACADDLLILPVRRSRRCSGSSHEQSLVVKKGWDAAMPCGLPDRLDLKNESNESVRISMNMYDHVWTCMNVHEYFQLSAFQLSSCPALPCFSLGDALLVNAWGGLLQSLCRQSYTSSRTAFVLWWTYQRWREYVGWVILLGCLTLFWLWTVFVYPSISIFLSPYNICQYNIHIYIK